MKSRRTVRTKASLEKVIVRPMELERMYGVSKGTAYRLMGENKFPQVIKLTERSVGWKKTVLDQHFGLID